MRDLVYVQASGLRYAYEEESGGGAHLSRGSYAEGQCDSEHPHTSSLMCVTCKNFEPMTTAFANLERPSPLESRVWAEEDEEGRDGEQVGFLAAMASWRFVEGGHGPWCYHWREWDGG